MQHVISLLDLLILFLAGARIIRLGTWDKITLPLRQFAVTDPDPKLRLNWLRRLLRTGEKSALGFILHCIWCFGVYGSFAVTSLFFLADTTAARIILVALAVAEVAPRIVNWELRTTGGE